MSVAPPLLPPALKVDGRRARRHRTTAAAAERAVTFEAWEHCTTTHGVAPDAGRPTMTRLLLALLG
jgi:hypothetical protein